MALMGEPPVLSCLPVFKRYWQPTPLILGYFPLLADSPRNGLSLIIPMSAYMLRIKASWQKSKRLGLSQSLSMTENFDAILEEWAWLIDWLIVDAWIARSHTSYSMVRHVWATIYLLPCSEWSSIDIWLNLRGWSLPERFSSLVGSFTSTLNVRVEGTSTLRGMRATRGTPPNVEEQRN